MDHGIGGGAGLDGAHPQIRPDRQRPPSAQRAPRPPSRPTGRGRERGQRARAGPSRPPSAPARPSVSQDHQRNHRRIDVGGGPGMPRTGPARRRGGTPASTPAETHSVHRAGLDVGPDQEGSDAEAASTRETTASAGGRGEGGIERAPARTPPPRPPVESATAASTSAKNGNAEDQEALGGVISGSKKSIRTG